MKYVHDPKNFPKMLLIPDLSHQIALRTFDEEGPSVWPTLQEKFHYFPLDICLLSHEGIHCVVSLTRG